MTSNKPSSLELLRGVNEKQLFAVERIDGICSRNSERYQDHGVIRRGVPVTVKSVSVSVGVSVGVSVSVCVGVSVSVSLLVGRQVWSVCGRSIQHRLKSPPL